MLIIIYVWSFLFVNQVFANDDLLKEFKKDEEILSNMSISAFLDDRRYIRFNITWDNSSDKVELMSIRFIELNGCKPLDDADRVPVKGVSYYIIPHLDLVNPANKPDNGCEYEVNVESHDLEQNLFQTQHYTVPDCVQDKCKCNPENAPYQISSITRMNDDVYFINWDKKSNVSLTIIEITYTRENLRTPVTKVRDENVTDNGGDISLPDLKEDVNYKVNIHYMVDECSYFSQKIFSLPSKLNTLPIVLVIVLSALLLVLFAFFVSSYRLRLKLKEYICGNYENSEDVYASSPLSLGTLKELVNPQYTDLEFVKNRHKYDKYEFPRNKIVIKKEIGEGAFGMVYYGHAFDLVDNECYTEVAIKQLRSEAPDDQKQDLLKEMEILKKVGEHKNIVRLLACVTINQPYMMILELVSGGSLKEYLMKLRGKWSDRRSKFSFAGYSIQDWQQNSFNSQDSKDLKYANVVFENSDNSYIQSENISKEENNLQFKKGNFEYISKYLSPFRIKQISEKSTGPISPISIASSGLPSCTDTEITTLSNTHSGSIANDYTSQIEAVLDNKELQHFALQIAQGMEYLERIKITHRDLAARNILMASNKVLKISDFGLSRTGTYVSSIGQKLPLRWMSIEAIEEKTCDNKSDVWSFGVVLWEIGTLGALPYQKTPNSLILYNLKMGKRLERPKICTDELYNLMLNCWNERAEKRPTFCDIVQQLDFQKEKIYLDFNALNPTYVFPSVAEEST